jgi:hypothetical protein
MSTSPKMIRNDIKLLLQESEKLKRSLTKKIKKTISLQNDNIQKEIFKKLNEGTILNILRNTERKDSIKTNITEYDLCMINKFDENLNSSLSFISEFDLEQDNENDKDSSFNSLDNDNSVEYIDISDKNATKSFGKEDDEEHKTKLEKEWADIQELLLNKNSP